MVSATPERLSAADAAWARLLVRSVASLAERIPEERFADDEARPYAYGLDAAEDQEAYDLWLTLGAEARAEVRARNRARLLSGHDVPTISVIVTRRRGLESDALARTVMSIQDQDGASVEILTAGPSDAAVVAVNRVAATAAGDYLAVVEGGDELERGVLADIALALADDPAVDVLYTDSDSVDAAGRRHRPFFKPGWAPDQLLSHMYVGRLLVVRASLFRDLGGYRPEHEGSHEYDLILRATDRPVRVVRLPIVGYHTWEPDDGSGKRDAADVLEETLQRRGERGVVEPGLYPGTYRVRRAIRGEPLVSVIVPFHNGAEHLRRCVRSLQGKAGYDRWEALLVDNRSWDPGIRAALARFERDPRIRVLSYPGRFNWAAINNYAARQSNGAHLLFMNADVEGRSEGWLEAMLEHAQRPEVGAVGARLLYPNGQVQHAGVVMGLGGGVAWHAFCYCPEGSGGYFGQSKVIRNYSAVTGACMMVRYDVFQTLDGFAEDLPVAYNDVDFCLRLHDREYRVVYTPYAELIHDESYSRGRMAPDAYAVETMTARWRARMQDDPFYNPNLDLHRPEGALATGRSIG